MIRVHIELKTCFCASRHVRIGFFFFQKRFDESKNITEQPQGLHPHLNCSTDPVNIYPRCTHPKWANPSWTGSQVPGVNLVNPPMKDTIAIPRGAYAVIRFKSDNPGANYVLWSGFLQTSYSKHLDAYHKDCNKSPPSHLIMPQTV